MSNKYINNHTDSNNIIKIAISGLIQCLDIFAETSSFNLNMHEEKLGLYGNIQETKRLKIPIPISSFLEVNEQ